MRTLHDAFAGQTVEAARRALTARFEIRSIDSAELDARILVGAVLGLDLTGMITAASRLLTPDQAARLEDFARRRLAGEPVARILGRKEFWGLPLQLSAETLVPRPDTETVVELALEMLRATRIPIVRCASPISAPAPARFCWRCCPNCRTPVGSAPTSAKRRYKRHAAMPSIWDWPVAPVSSPATMRRRCRASFDLIVSNPPYIRSADIAGLAIEVRDHDPLRALDGGADGLDAYRALVPQAAALLRPAARWSWKRGMAKAAISKA